MKSISSPIIITAIFLLVSQSFSFAESLEDQIITRNNSPIVLKDRTKFECQRFWWFIQISDCISCDKGGYVQEFSIYDVDFEKTFGEAIAREFNEKIELLKQNYLRAKSGIITESGSEKHFERPITKLSTKEQQDETTKERDFSTNNLLPSQIASLVYPSVVHLTMEMLNGQTTIASGFFVKDNIVATNKHVVEGAIRGFAKIIGQSGKFKILGTAGISRDVDVALLSIEGAKASPLKLGDSGNVKIGDHVYAIGNPLGLEGTFSEGVISNFQKYQNETLLQITAPISPGSSGGPLVNGQGEVIGLTAYTLRNSVAQNINFAVPAYSLKLLLSNITEVKALSVPSKQLRFSNQLKFITGGPNQQQPVYGNGFNRSVAQYIKWELDIYHDASDFDVHIDLASTWFRHVGEIIFRETYNQIRIPASPNPSGIFTFRGDWIQGWSDGRYNVSIIFNDKEVTRGSFMIYGK